MNSTGQVEFSSSSSSDPQWLKRLLRVCPSVIGPAAAPAQRTAAGPSMATVARGQSSSSGGLRACCYGDQGAWPAGPRTNLSSSEGLRPGRPESGRTPSGARWACPEGARPSARGRSAAGRWRHGSCATTRRPAFSRKTKTLLLFIRQQFFSDRYSIFQNKRQILWNSLLFWKVQTVKNRIYETKTRLCLYIKNKKQTRIHKGWRAPQTVPPTKQWLPGPI